MNRQINNSDRGGFDALRTPTGAVDFVAYQIKGRREQAKAVAAAFSWLNDRFTRALRK